MILKNFVPIIFLLIFMQVKSQTPTWEWARCAKTGSGSTALGEGWSNTANADGNNYVVGMFKDTLIFGTDTLTESVGLTAFVAKYNSTGNLQWGRQASGSGYSWGNCVAADAFGNAYIGGYFQQASISFDTIALNNVGGGHDMFITKYNSSGNVIWAKSFGEVAGGVDLQGITTDALGNVLVTGYYSSATLNLGGVILTNTDSTGYTIDFFLAKFNANGNIIWAKSGIGSGVEYGMSVACDASADAYVVGNFSSTHLILGSDTLTNTDPNGTADIFILKYDSNGNLIWAKSAGGVEQDYPFASAMDLAGDFFITGFFDSPSLIFGLDTVYYSGASNVFLAKYNSSGNIDWAKSQTSGSASARSVATDQCGSVFLIGGILSDTVAFDSIVLIPDTPDPDNFYDNMYIVRYNSSGNATWGTSLPFGGDDGIGIASDGSGNVYVGGDFAPPVAILGNDTMINKEEETPFVSKLNIKCTDGISQIQNMAECVWYPNPFSNSVNIAVDDNEELQITLYDFLSRKLLQKTFTNSTTINTGQLANGLYIYELRNSKGEVKNGKVIKQ